MSTLPTQVPGSGPLPPPTVELGEPDIDYEGLVTEDHKPVERIFIEKLYRLLTHPLYANWPGPGEGRPFLVLADVGWFYQRTTPAVVPDILLSLDVTGPKDLHVKQGHSYYQWDLGKQPDVVIEAVSDRTGGEETLKKALYARLGVPYYAVFDPDHLLSGNTLRTYELSGGVYSVVEPGPWPPVGLGLRLWQGKFEGFEGTWLRWCDARGEIIPTGEERARRAEERIRELEAELRQLKGEPPAGGGNSPRAVPCLLPRGGSPLLGGPARKPVLAPCLLGWSSKVAALPGASLRSHGDERAEGRPPARCPAADPPVPG